MKRKRILLPLSLCMALAMTGCGSSSEGEDIVPLPPVPAERVPISLNLSVQTRATDTSFEQGDRIGLYVVYGSDSQPGTLLSQGNYADNHLFTFNGKWTTTEQLYWKDQTTRADFYVYYPYQPSVPSVNDMSFSTLTDQTTPANRSASDLLWGKAAGQAPTEQSVNILTSHLLSSAVVILEAGNGFTAETLAQAAPVVTVNGVKTQAHVDLAGGTLTASGQPTTVTLGQTATGDYRAIIVPQTVEGTNFISVRVAGQDYVLSKPFTFESGKRHTFTVKVNKTSSGINVGITQWETDDADNGGVAE